MSYEERNVIQFVIPFSRSAFNAFSSFLEGEWLRPSSGGAHITFRFSSVEYELCLEYTKVENETENMIHLRRIRNFLESLQ